MERFRMPARYLHDLISGAEMDLTIHEYPTFERLKEYCYRVAGAGGLTLTPIFGFSDPKEPGPAEKVGAAFPVNKIIPAVREECSRRSNYLPGEGLVCYRGGE